MNIGERIKKLRKEKGLSVDYIAEKLGKNRATVYRYESSEIENLPYPILVPLAEILGTTPMYLMGCEVEDIKVTKEEKQLLENYNKLNAKGKEKLLDYSDDLTTNIKYMDNTDNVIELNTNKENKKDDDEIFVPYTSLDQAGTTIACHDDDLTDEEKEMFNQITLNEINKERLIEWNKKHNK